MSDQKQPYAPLECIAGNVGRDPEMHYTPNGRAVLEFSLAVTRAYDGPNATEWVDVTVWDEALQNLAVESIVKGSRVVVSGPLKEREYNGKVYRQISAHRLGLVNWFRKDQPSTAPAPSASRAVPTPAVEPDDDGIVEF